MADDTFLPRIQSVFYAVFDVRQGPKIVYQVPEGLIATAPGPTSASSSNSGSYASSPVPTAPHSEANSRASSISVAVVSPTTPSIPSRPESRFKFSPRRAPSASLGRALFNFDDVSKYIIPASPLCGRLVVCNARQSKIIGFPSELSGNYERNYFRFNVCFVFDRSADLSCYEPIVRKVSRVLATCEHESSFLSNPETSPNIYAVLEQLYEDLNSYAETSIPIDDFNSIELKLFPFFPNPPPVTDWMVPLALIDLTRVVEPNWDLTMVKVSNYIDGTNHVSRIAHLAHCDVDLTRQAIAHLLYYQVIMTIDIFQYSNMYTLRKSVQWLADEAHVKDECGAYVVREGRAIPDWPKLLHLYSRLKPGKTVFEWMQDYDVRSLGIDARRFTSFGVIKGFLRRVHRWPVLLDDIPPTSQPPTTTPPITGRRRSMSIPTPGITSTPSTAPPNLLITPQTPTRLPLCPIRRLSDATAPLATVSATSASASPIETRMPPLPATPSAAELSLGRQLSQRRTPTTPPRKGREAQGRRNTLTSGDPVRPRPSRSPSNPAPVPQPLYPPALPALLDGEHHTDELCTMFSVGWPMLEKWLAIIGGGKGEGELGNVLIIYR
ncbi:NPR2-domain-containing protein [Peniophora sp. CONT]|nr:NPR2-domain-containing protein [Peniophora sp. CONT]